MNDLTEQWNLDGNCSQCRRKKYCSKRCKAYLESMSKELKSTIINSNIGKKTSIIMSMLGGKK